MRYAFRGRPAVREFFEADDNFDQRIEWHTIIFDPAQQLGTAEYTYEGSHRYHGAVLVRLENGLISHWREHQHVDDGRSWEAFAGWTHFS
jgi:hypothetical protein